MGPLFPLNQEVVWTLWGLGLFVVLVNVVSCSVLWYIIT